MDPIANVKILTRTKDCSREEVVQTSSTPIVKAQPLSRTSVSRRVLSTVRMNGTGSSILRQLIPSRNSTQTRIQPGAIAHDKEISTAKAPTAWSMSMGLSSPTTNLYALEDAPAEPEDADVQKMIQEKLPYPEFSDVFSKRDSDKVPPTRGDYDCKINLLPGMHVRQLNPGPLYPMTPKQLDFALQYVRENLRKGFIEESKAPYSSPVLLVKKGDTFRFCIDFRKVNAITEKDKYPLPLISETFMLLRKAKVFTILDIRQAFHRLLISCMDTRDMTTFRTRWGNYRYTVMPFRITNGPAMFQRFINHIFADLTHLGVFPYVDDIIIASEDPARHDEVVKEVLRRLRGAELQADIKKSKFNVQAVKFLGHVISTTGVAMDPAKVEAIQEWPLPTSVKAIQSFASFASYYRDLCPKLAAPSAVLSALTKKGGWRPLGPKEVEAFEEIKRLFTTEEIVSHFDESAYETSLDTDASDGALAGALHQRLTKDSPLRPVAFFSRKLADTEMRYDIHDKEMLAVVTSISHFRRYLLSVEKPFVVYTDHKALE